MMLSWVGDEWKAHHQFCCTWLHRVKSTQRASVEEVGAEIKDVLSALIMGSAFVPSLLGITILIYMKTGCELSVTV